CVDLNDGDSSMIDELDYTMAGIPASYKLSRKGLSYKAQVNVDFKPKTPTWLAAKVRAKAASCLKQASPMMKGPGDGQSPEASLYDPAAADNKADAKPPHAHGITLTSAQEQEKIDREAVEKGESGFRENSESWSEKTPCETITHEVLHLL